MSGAICEPDGVTGSGRANPPGQLRLRARTGTWSTFRQALLDGLGRQTVPPDGPADAARPLSGLSTRAPSDPTIALVDAFAAVCDVLTFYSERILNEGYLDTATEERSVVEIARAIGYEPGPGVAATTALAFTVDPNRPQELTLPAGLPVMSVPRDEAERPVTFETSEDLLARPEWNVLPARATTPQTIERGTRQLYLVGADVRLRPGDPIVVLGRQRLEHPAGGDDTTERWDLRFVTDVTPSADADHTVVTLDRGLGDPHTPPAREGVRVLTFRERAGLFGWNAPDARMMSPDITANADLMAGGQWKDFRTLADDVVRRRYPDAVDLDREYPAIVMDGWICLHSSTQVELYRVRQVNPAQRTEFSLSSRVTRVFVDSAEHLDAFTRRATTVLLGSEELALAERPDPDPVAGHELEVVPREAPPLPAGRLVLVTGTSTSSGEPQAVRTQVEEWRAEDGCAVVHLTDALPPLVRASVTLHGNVAMATHGATVAEEVLGSGDAGIGHQTFRLGHRPLTWVPAVPLGADSSLEVRVDGVRWERVRTLFGAGPRDRVYRLHRDHEGATLVTFGDGVRGARLPSGTENVRGTYRTGIGLAGAADAGSLTLLQRRPPGLQAVVNPQPAAGAADPDAFEDVRRLAPLTVLTLDRLVSLQDYEDFARSFPGIGKARATRLWDGHRGFMHLTVAGASGGELPDDDPLLDTLEASIASVQDPDHHVVVAPHREVAFGLTMGVLVADAYREPDVLAAVRDALAVAFSATSRAFGEPVTTAQVVTVAHAVDGIVAVDLDDLHRLEPDSEAAGAAGATASGPGHLTAAAARWDGTRATRTELLVLDPDAVALHGMDDT